ncbi:MAG TPA: MFS transporter, partial [Burkholderiales bacterium]|nr:MFS transporter [Burkholderiales bacterium]
MSSAYRFSWLPAGTHTTARPLIAARALRAFADGYVSLLLPFYLTLLGFDAFEVGLLVTSTLLGSGIMTLSIGFVAHRYSARKMLLAASLLMIATGFAFSFVTDFWPLLLIAFFGTLNPSSGDVSVFLPLEQSLLAEAAPAESRTALFARYSLAGSLIGALGAQSAVLPGLAATYLSLTPRTAMQAMFWLYAALGLVVMMLYRPLNRASVPHDTATAQPLRESRGIVYRMAALFSMDAFGGGFAVQSLFALWLAQRFDVSLATAGTIFFWVGLFSAFSQLLSAKIAQRIGLVNTMVYTHIPSSVFLIMVPFMPTLTLAVVFLLLRSALSQMDVPARTSYVMAVVSPAERAAAASVTAVPRSLASAASPSLAGYLLSLSSFGTPL